MLSFLSGADIFFYIFCVIFVVPHSICTVCSDHHICLSLRLPNAFALNSIHSMTDDGPATEDNSSLMETDTLKIEEVQAPATGTRKAKVLYDYDAADSSELSLLADEVRFHHKLAVSWSNSDYRPLPKISRDLGLNSPTCVASADSSKVSAPLA